MGNVVCPLLSPENFSLESLILTQIPAKTLRISIINASYFNLICSPPASLIGLCVSVLPAASGTTAPAVAGVTFSVICSPGVEADKGLLSTVSLWDNSAMVSGGKFKAPLCPQAGVPVEQPIDDKQSYVVNLFDAV